jgi:hypothetical protein
MTILALSAGKLTTIYTCKFFEKEQRKSFEIRYRAREKDKSVLYPHSVHAEMISIQAPFHRAQRQDPSIPAHALSKLVLVTFHPLSKAKETFLSQ